MNFGVKHVLTEIFIVVVGILLAFNVEFNVERYFEREKEQHETHDCLMEVKKELLYNLENEIKGNIVAHKGQLNSIHEIFKVLYFNKENSDLFTCVKDAFHPLIFAAKDGAYKELKNHHLSSIKSEELPKLIVEVYEVRFSSITKFEEDYLPSQFYTLGNEIIGEEFYYNYVYDDSSNTFAITPKLQSLEHFRNNAQLGLLLHRAQRNRVSLLKHYNDLETLIKKTIKEIDKELSLQEN